MLRNIYWNMRIRQFGLLTLINYDQGKDNLLHPYFIEYNDVMPRNVF